MGTRSLSQGREAAWALLSILMRRIGEGGTRGPDTWSKHVGGPGRHLGVPKRQEQTRPSSELGRTPPADLQPEVPLGARPPSCALALRPPRCRSRRLASGNGWPEAPTTSALRPSGKASLLGPGRQAASQSHCHSLATRWRKCAVQPLSLSSERPVSPSAHHEAPSYSHQGPGGLWCPELCPPGQAGDAGAALGSAFRGVNPHGPGGAARSTWQSGQQPACGVRPGHLRRECVPGPRLPAAGRGTPTGPGFQRSPQTNSTAGPLQPPTCSRL